MKILAAVPATKTSHLPFQEELLTAVNANLKNVAHELCVGEANESGWQFVVDQFNYVAECCVIGGFDYAWIIESDVISPENALQHLLSIRADVAVAVVPNHRYPDNIALDALYKDAVCVAEFVNAESLSSMPKYMRDVENRVLTTKENPLLFAGTGCILIKRSVFESGIRFINDSRASYDVLFWRDLVKKSFLGAVDGYVVCKHLGV